MSQSTVSVRMDEALKQEFDTVCNDLGLSMSTAVTMLAKKWPARSAFPLRSRWIPSTPPKPGPSPPFHRPDGGHRRRRA